MWEGTLRYLFQRVVHNDRGWLAPSPGRLGFTGDGGYLRDYGFGHEDWNFCLDTCGDGHVYGYMYYRPRTDEGSFNIMFATYDKGEGWALAGFYESAAFVGDGATFPASVIRRRAKELKSLDEAGSLGGKYAGATVSDIVGFLKEDGEYYRWKALPRNVHRVQKPLRLPKSITSGFGAYFTRPTEISAVSWDKILSFASDFVDQDPMDDYNEGGDIEFPEGEEYERRHKSRERNPALVAKAKAQFKGKHGRLFCEVCLFDFREKYGNAGDGFIEAHHNIPVHEMKPGHKTKISDLSLVCSNCHRILHRRRPWLTIPALRKLLREVARKRSF